MDEIEISIERGSEPPRRASSEMPQINPRIGGGVAVVFVLALVMWLGVQTPVRAPATTTTSSAVTSTSLPQMAVAPPTTLAAPPGTPPELDALDHWLEELAANPPESLASLDQSVFLFMADFGEGGYLVELGPERFRSTPLTCEGQQVRRLLGRLPGVLIVTAGLSVCKISIDRPLESVPIPEVTPSHVFIDAEDQSGWFCERKSSTSATVTRFDVELGLEESHDALSCPIAAEGGALLLLDVGQQPYVWRLGEELPVARAKVEDGCQGGSFGERWEVCRVDTEVEVRDYLSDAAIRLPADIPIEVFWEVAVSPSRTRVFLQFPWPVQDGFGEEGPFIVDSESKEIAEIESLDGPLRVIWISDTQLLMLSDPPIPGVCNSCTAGLSVIDAASGVVEPLLVISIELGVVSVQVLAS